MNMIPAAAEPPRMIHPRGVSLEAIWAKGIY
jgi:hypothetical protein